MHHFVEPQICVVDLLRNLMLRLHCKDTRFPTGCLCAIVIVNRENVMQLINAHTVLRCCEGPLHCHSDITTNCGHSVVIQTWRVQSLPQYHNDSVPCSARLSGLSRVWQICVGWVSPILDLTVSRSSESR